MASAAGQVMGAGPIRHTLATVGWTWEGASTLLQEELQGLIKSLDSAREVGTSVGQEEATRAFMSALSAKSPVTAQHCARVGRYAGLIATALDLPVGAVLHVRWCGLLHDVGKLGIAEEVLEKPGPLTPGEWAQMKLHPEIGARIIQSCRSLLTLVPAILMHHERVDGKGYPAGIPGTQIPLESRIVSICDAYDTMTSDRPYRPALDPLEAIERLRQGAGTQFDTDLTRLFCVQVIPSLPVGLRPGNLQPEAEVVAD